MHFEVDTLDDLLLSVYPHLLTAPAVVSGRGRSLELLGVSALIRQPRARLSRSETRGRAFSCLGELVWYLSKSNALDPIAEYIPHYRTESDDGETVYGGYGPRLFAQNGHDQVSNVLELLRSHPSSRRAVIQLFDAGDISVRRTEIPCTTTLQFFVREERLHLIASMRSNDAYLGLPHDVFCFTMLQEIIARSLGVEIGDYRHIVGSMHLYDDRIAEAEAFMGEGFQRRIEMPAMPLGDPWPSIQTLVESEARARALEPMEASNVFPDPYWADLLRLLQIYHTKDNDAFEALRAAVQFDGYRTYVRTRAATRRRNAELAKSGGRVTV